MADVFFMGRTGETMAVAAIALCGPVFSVFSAFNTLLGFGACTAASMALGRGEYQRVRQFTSFCLYSSLLVGSLSMAAVWIAMKPMLSLLGADEVTAPLCCGLSACLCRYRSRLLPLRRRYSNL